MNFEMDKQLTAIFSVLETMQSILKCSVCLDLLSYPVTTKCGHSFCGVCIDHILSGSKGSGSCPLCMSVMTKRSLNENKKIVGLVDAVRKVISCVKEDVGYDDSNKKKKEQTICNTPSNLSASDKVATESVSPIRRGARNREQVIAPVIVDKRKRLLPSELKSSTNEAGVVNATKANTTGGLSSKSLSSNLRSTGKITLPCVTEIKGTNKSSLNGNYLQATADFHFDVPLEKHESSVKSKVEEWLDNGIRTETTINYPDDSIKTANECNHELIYPGKYGALSGLPPCIADLKEKAGISSSQASTVIFTPGRPVIDLKSQDNTQSKFELEEKQIVVAFENFTDGLLEEKENTSNKVNPQVNCNAKIKRSNKRILSEKNVASKNTNKSNILEFENSEVIIGQSHVKCKPSDVGLQENLKEDVMHHQANSESKVPAGHQKNIDDDKLYNDFSEQHPNSKGHNIRFASEIKCKILEISLKPSRLTVKKRTRQSPGWSHIENVKKDLRSKHTVLNIKGGEGKQIGDSSKTDTLTVIPDLSQESVIVIDDPSQDQQTLRKSQEAGRFKRFKNAFSFKGKFTECANGEDQSGSSFKRRTKACYPRNRKKVVSSVVEPPSETTTNTKNLDIAEDTNVKNSDLFSIIDGKKCESVNEKTLEGSSATKTAHDNVMNQGNRNIQISKKSVEVMSMNLTKVDSNLRLTRSKRKEIDQIPEEYLLLEHDEVKLLNFAESSKSERMCDMDTGNLIAENLKHSINPETCSQKSILMEKNVPIKSAEYNDNTELCGNGLSEALNLNSEQYCNKSSANNCRKSFNLSVEPFNQQNHVDSNALLRRNQNEINSHKRKVSDQASPEFSSTFNNEEKDSQIGRMGSVSFVKKGKFEKRASTLCQHSLPCGVFQALKKLSNLMMVNCSFDMQCCFSMDSSSDVPISKQMPCRKSSKKDTVAHSNTLSTQGHCKHEKLSRHHSTYQENASKLTAISENINDCRVHEKVSQNILICKEKDYGCLPFQEANNWKKIIHCKADLKHANNPPLSSRKLKFSPLLSPTSPLQSSLESVNHNDKHCEDTIIQQSQFSLSILPDLVNNNSPGIDKTSQADNINKPNSYVVINEPLSSQRENTFKADLHDVSSECESVDFELRNDKNFNVISADSTVLSSSLSGLSKMKRFRGITTLSSYEDSSSDEDLANLKRTTKRVRRANIESQSPVGRNSDINLPNTEKLRDFECYDENVWNYYRTDNHSDKRMEVSPMSVKCSSFKKSPTKERTASIFSIDNKLKNENDVVTHTTDDDDEFIPGTEEVLKRDVETELVSKKPSKDIFNDTINLITQVSPVSTITSSNIELPLSTRNLFKKCDKSLNLAEKIIAGNMKVTITDNVRYHLAKETKVNKDNSGDSRYDKEMNHEIVHSENFSNRSILIPSQQKFKMKQDFHTSEKVLTSNLSEFPDDNQKITGCESPKKISKELFKEKDKFSRDSDQESEELFKSISASIHEQDAKEILDDNKEAVTLPGEQKKDCMTIVCTGLSNAEINKVNSFVENVCQRGTKISNIWTKEVTHIVAKTDADGVTDRTLKYLYGVAYGIWIVSFSWIVDSLNSSILLPEEDYEVLDCTGYPGPNRGRKRSSPIFKNCQFCLVPPFANISEEQFIELITICGGEVVSDAYNFNEPKNYLKLVAIDSDSVLDYNILEDIKRCGKVLIAHDWIIECIGMCTLVALQSYIFGEPSEREIMASGVKGTLLSETQDIL